MHETTRIRNHNLSIFSSVYAVPGNINKCQCLIIYFCIMALGPIYNLEARLAETAKVTCSNREELSTTLKNLDQHWLYSPFIPRFIQQEMQTGHFTCWYCPFYFPKLTCSWYATMHLIQISLNFPSPIPVYRQSALGALL